VGVVAGGAGVAVEEAAEAVVGEAEAASSAWRPIDRL
jgi:hypothetical protein